MPYVMVPVPEEHVPEAMQLILRIVARASSEPWDEASIEALFGEVDEASRFVLSAVARGSIANGQVPDIDVARAIELGQREVLAIAREINDTAAASSHLPLIAVQNVSVTLPNGRVKDQRVLSMARELAELVRVAEQREQAAGSHHLLDRTD